MDEQLMIGTKKKRLELHEKLCQYVPNRQVYYNPPESIKMSYPCIVYNRDSISKIPADDIGYLKHSIYSITVIDFVSDSPIVDSLLDVPFVSFSSSFVSDNLYHTNLRLYY